jgi:hypothetical protein
VPGANSSLQGVVALATNNVWAVGYSGAGYFSTLTEHWDGSAWSIVPSPNDESDVLYGVSKTGPNDIWAAGDSQSSFGYYFATIEHWNGSNWSIVPSVSNGPHSHLYGLAAVSPGDVWAVGTDSTYPLIERWNGSSWNIFSSPLPAQGGALFGVTAISPCDVWAAGRTYATNIGFQTLNEHFTCQSK